MKKQKTKKKLSKTRTRTRTPELDATPKFMPETSQEPEGDEALALTPLAPLGTDGHRN